MCPFKPLSELVLKCDTGINLSESCCGGVEPAIDGNFWTCGDIFPGAAVTHGGAWFLNAQRFSGTWGRMSGGRSRAQGLEPACTQVWGIFFFFLVLLCIKTCLSFSFFPLLLCIPANYFCHLFSEKKKKIACCRLLTVIRRQLPSLQRHGKCW